MRGVNLIPADRRAAKQRRRRLRCWIGVGAAWIGIVLGACVVTEILWGNDYGATAAELSQTQQHVADLDRQVNNFRRQLSAAQIARQAAQSVSDQPDWSILLSILGNSVGDDVTLREITLARKDEVNATASSSPAYTLQLRGFARSQPQVSQFVLRLQQNGLFDQVKLLRSGREPVMNIPAIGFDIACEIADGSAPPPPPAINLSKGARP